MDRAVPLMEHFLEIKRRFVRAAVVGLITTVVAFFFYQDIFELLKSPALEFLDSSEGEIVFHDVTEAWAATAKVCMLAGFAMAMPYILFEVMMFLRPGLTGGERRYLYGLVPGGLVAFAGGMAFAYFIMIPPAIKFMLTFGSELATPFISLGSYVNLIITLMFWMGIIFEIPIVLFFLAKIGVVNTRWLRRQRRWAILVAVVLGAVITPTFDPVNQMLVAGPVVVLYEAGVLLAMLAERGRGEAQVAVKAQGPAGGAR